jgi:hypothetical protein
MSKEDPSKQGTTSGNPADLNWLDGEGWKAIPYPTDDTERRQMERVILAYVRGCLKMYNALKRPPHPYKATRIPFERNPASPATCTVRAFLNPFVRINDEGGFAHLIPQEPPPPDEFDLSNSTTGR